MWEFGEFDNLFGMLRKEQKKNTKITKSLFRAKSAAAAIAGTGTIGAKMVFAKCTKEFSKRRSKLTTTFQSVLVPNDKIKLIIY